MNRGDVARALLVGALMAVGGYLAGRNQADDAVQQERDEARREAEQWRERARLHPWPSPIVEPAKQLDAPPTREVLAAATGAGAASPSTAGATGPSTRATAGERPETLELKDVTTLDELTARLLEFAASRLAEGPQGHLELLRAMDATFVRDERIRRMVNDEREAVRLIYPMLKFAVNHEGQVTGFVETVFRTMAESPTDLEGVDDNTLELITEGLAMVLPSIVSEERLEVLRGQVEQILKAPRESLPSGIRGNLGELQRLLQAWAPPMTVDEILAKLADLPTDEAARRDVLQQARRLTADDWEKVDMAAVLGPGIAAGDWQALSLLRAAAPKGATLAALDARVARAGAGLDGNVAYSYLSATNRPSWAAARGFLETWLGAGGGQSPGFASVISRLGPRPSAAELQDLAARGDLSEENRQMLLKTAGN
jgi:hypothetical protein